MKEILKYAIWAGLYAVLLVPFIVANNMFFPYITGKAFTFRIIVEIIFALWLILILKEKEFRPKWSWLSGSVILLTFVLLIADINAVAPFKALWSNYERMEGWVTFVHLLAYFLVLSSMFNKEKLWLWFLRANLAAGALMAVSSIDQATEARFSGPLGNPIYIAVYFLFIFFFTLILLYKDVLVKNLTDWKAFRSVLTNVLFYVYLISSFLSLYVVYRTSRGALLGALGGIFVATVLIALFEKERPVLKQISLGIIIGGIVMVAGFLSLRGSDFVQNNPTLKRLAEISWSNVNGQARQLIWPMALKGFEEKPLLGWGQEGFNYVFNKYYDPRMYGQENWFDRAHNAPLDFLIAGGILGLLSYLALFISSLYLLWFRKNTLKVAEKAIITGLLAGYFFQGIFVFDNNVGYIMFFITLAYIHSRLVEDEEVKKIKNQGPLATFAQNEEYQNYLIIPGIVILTVACLWFVNVPGIMANRTLIKSLMLVQKGQLVAGIESFKQALSYNSLGNSEIREQLISYAPAVLRAPQFDQQVKRDFIGLTINEVEKQISLVPSDARYYILTGSLLNNIGDSEHALPYIKKAIELSPDKQTMRFELIQSLYNLGRSAEAMAEAKAAYELDKNFEQAKTFYVETVKNEIKVNPAFKVEGEKILKELAIK